MSWQREGQRIFAEYLGTIPVTGIVESSRVRYGGSVQHTLLLDSPVQVYGSEWRTRLLIDESQIVSVEELV